MKDLFVLDSKDYNPNGKVFRRPSVRAVICQNGKVLLVYSKKYNYYKFPGGGIENDENHIQALIREVCEETGYQIIPESIQEYGRVLRRQKDTKDATAIFEQENFYYFCQVSSQLVDRSLDGYEEEEGFTPMWVDALDASRHNQKEYHAEGADLLLIKREAKVLDLLDQELRRIERQSREIASIKALGNLDYQGMLDFVEQNLLDSTENPNGGKSDISYSRFEHTKRVLGWAKRLYDLSDCKEQLRYEDLMIATIFHDVGRNVAITTGLPHAKESVPITRNYLLGKGFDSERVEYICELVGSHSDKYRMAEPDLDPNLILLMEADLFDDMGALGVVIDCMIVETRKPDAHFTDCYDHIMRYTRRLQMDNPMRTEAAKKLWDEKTRLVVDFTDALKMDLEMD